MRLTYELPVEEEDLLSLELWARGAVGVEILEGSEAGEASAGLLLVAYFEAPMGSELASDPPGWRERGIRRVDRQRIESRDWLESYRAAARPFDVGPRLRIDPGDPPGEARTASERILLRIPARRAFGTGTHESTRLLLGWLQELDLSGLEVIDVGTGSGILGLAALALGAERVVGIDTDAAAVFVARETARSNDARLPLVVGSAGCLAASAFDLLLLNILPSAWAADLDAVGRCLAESGRALVSGASEEDADRLRERLARRGWHLVEERADGEWRAFEVRPPGSPVPSREAR